MDFIHKSVGIFSAVLLLGAAQSALAQSVDFYCGDRELGDQFYCIQEVPEEALLEEPMAPAPKPEPVIEPEMDEVEKKIKEFDVFKEEINKARQVAVFTGEPEDIEKYMRLQKKAAQMSSRFMEEYQFLGWQDPTLSYTAHVPVETFAKNAYQSERRKEIERHIKLSSERYGFFYFYSKDCKACTEFSPIVKRLSARHGLSVIPVAQKGLESIEWPGTKPDNGISDRVGLIGNVTPAIVLYDSSQESAVPISYGAVSLETLENRIYMLTKQNEINFVGGDVDVH